MRIGLVLPQKKKRILEHLQQSFAARGIRVNFEDLEMDGAAPGRWDGAVLLSHSQHLFACEEESVEKQRLVDQMQRWEERNKGVPVLDPMRLQRFMSSRPRVVSRMQETIRAQGMDFLRCCPKLDPCHAVQGSLEDTGEGEGQRERQDKGRREGQDEVELKAKEEEVGDFHWSIRMPKSFVLENGADVEFAFKNHSMNLPVVIKPVYDDGRASSHDLFIAWELEEIRKRLHKIVPCLVQEFVPHNKMIYKIYCVGSQLCVIHRKLQQENSEDYRKTISDATKLPASALTAIRDLICQAIAMEFNHDPPGPPRLFGVDVVRRRDTNEFYIVDLNYFPGFHGMNNFPEALRDVIMECVRFTMGARSECELKLDEQV
ncbi:hypothetical protein GUITHDRAFT_111570 [Guillardia theta CCMP2712]|uniref:ATP-grasp domain-containing protein n=1 Tax=Guillardia theta (strain CCMP2712) TaxID=905079 RepID=L1J2J3_GUITC|nr:hypothetical protein GUITHDRAFT_111570 [Guillardia theta CCMP2712]EKX42295.1 hypothetical protein GUITHDRAFT_111570 [Guillardia theta CCMP2712]|eukprot:XP_005829275.1 hypothetical protein GUITHDRAFT_111570 [Guillardia theta CCMP2712]